jgi:hypothetical protein
VLPLIPLELAKAEGRRAHGRIINSIRLADAAVKSNKGELADRMFQAALSREDGGYHDFLSKKHTQLLQGKWSPDPKK